MKVELVRDNYETHTRKLIRSMKMYFKPIYKKMIFEIIPEVQNSEGVHHYKVPVDKKMEKVYGTLEFDLEYTNGMVTMTNNTYDDLLYKGYATTLRTYKGIVYRDEKDLMKIKMANMLDD